MKLSYTPKVELTEAEKNALKLVEQILYEVCSKSECYNCIIKDFCERKFDPMDTPEQINKILIGES